MGFRHCEACDGLISARAVVCPHCDIPLPGEYGVARTTVQGTRANAWVPLLLVVIITILLGDASGLNLFD